MKTSWAILLTKFNDNNDEPYHRTRYEEIFTTAGTGKWNMVDHFRDMSHGKLDLTESRVFGWYTLDQKRSEYVGSGKNLAGRRDLITWARKKATDDGVDLDKFFSVVVVLNANADLCGGAQGVICGDDGSNLVMSWLSPSYLGQEMGHRYGLGHSRREGSMEDYQDPFDVMSTPRDTRMAPHPIYTERDPRGNPIFTIGPGLNAANMWSRGWLDETRVWSDQPERPVHTTVQLRPLHRRDLPGLLAIRFNDYFVEFRTNSGWDAGFGPAVLVHRFEGGRSYIVSDNDGNLILGPGSAISTPKEFSVLGSGFFIRVTAIDNGNQTATISLGRTPAQLPRDWPLTGPFNTPWVKWSDLIAAHEALVVLGGRALTVSNRSLVYRVLENVMLHESGGALVSNQLKAAIRQEAVSNIAAWPRRTPHARVS